MKHALCKALLPLLLAASSAANADDLADAASAELALSGSRSPTAQLLAQQNGYVGNPAGSARLRPGGRADTKSMTAPKSAAAILYPPPPGFKTPKTNPARAHDIYKSPY
ncbi:hypothetical protein AWB75_00677 [Caballeronia catudaia]|uniref:Lipoprotein n=1 Tax=Caballeronia catudaia TaxID=1777136 RepID=A0A157ZFK5_9BURK|nr:hypothetical protein [Caballeronia catudaia]SAK44295.1 hypothetical protein AWB75_00677 [Caballeronia catudaia]